MANQVWKFQNGTSEDEHLGGAVVGSNGSYVFVGITRGDWSGINAGGYDWAAFKVDAKGDILWSWQNGTSKDDIITAAATAENEAVVVVGYQRDDSGFRAAKLSGDGTLLWEWEDGTESLDFVYALAMTEDGSAVIAGSTQGDWNASNFGNNDCAACKLDADGMLLWKYQEGTGLNESFRAAAAGEDSSVILAGSSRGNWSGVNLGEMDFIAVKLDPDGKEVWRWQDGTTSFDVIRGVAIGISGSVFLTGTTDGNWSGVNVGGLDLIACKLDASGNELWRWQGGTGEEDRAYGIFADDDESVVLTGYTDGVWSNVSSGETDFAAVKLDENGAELWRWQNGSSGIDYGGASASRATSAQILVAGSTSGSWALENAGGFDFAAVLVDISTPSLAPTTSTETPFRRPTSSPVDISTPSIAPTASTETPFRRPTSSPVDISTPSIAPTTSTETPFRRPTSSPVDISTPSLAPTTSTETPFRRPTSSPVDISTPSLAPTTSTETPFRRPTSSPTTTDNGGGLNITTMVAVLSCVLGVVVIAGAGWACRRRTRKSADAAFYGEGELWTRTKDSDLPSIGPPSQGEDSYPLFVVQPKRRVTGDTQSASFRTISDAPGVGEEVSTNATLPFNDVRGKATCEIGNKHIQVVHQSSATAWAGGGSPVPPIDAEDAVNDIPESKQSEQSPIDGRRKAVRGIGVAQAVLGAAQELARMSQFPGVTELAGLVIVLMNMVNDKSDIIGVADTIIKRCRSVLFLLQRAASVLQEVGNSEEPGHRLLIEDVRDAVSDLVEIIKTYQSKRRISQVMMSTLFKRRQDEAEAVVEAAISRLHFGLQVQIGHELNKLGQDLRGGLFIQRQGTERLHTDSARTLLLEARCLRRQRKLDAVEIPERYVTVTNELLGKGGFGSVYMADYNGRNAAAKVVQVEHELGRLASLKEDMTGGIHPLEPNMSNGNSRRKAFWRELQAMIRLRSPHTVNVYGAITSRRYCLVLVMELLPGGDLRALLKAAVEPLEEAHARRIVGDICAGMSFLHQKETVHGDLKSPNVLFDGNGRAKIADFGTSKWPQLTNSTGLATYTTTSGQRQQMSYAWAAPEVLDAQGTSYESDVYSFGVVVWEVLSREMPWADECLRNIYVRVMIKDDRLEIPSDAPSDMADIMKACWAGVSRDRPTFNDITEMLRRE